MKARVQFDGGCKPNPGQKYGSYEVTIDDSFSLTRNRFPLGFGTNNEAEFESLLTALGDLLSACQKSSILPNRITVNIFTDSSIVRGWLLTFYKVDPKKIKNERRLAMYGMAEKCIRALEPFLSFTVEWIPRASNVASFGH